MTGAALKGPHWTFALRLYAQPGVSDACLLLQDRLGVDVNVLLFAVFAAAERGIALDASDLQRIDAAVAPWREEVVAALRRIRRRMKTGPEPAPSGPTERVRTQIKSAELHAEQIEQAMLADWLDRHAVGRLPSPVELGPVIAMTIAHYAGAQGTAPGGAAGPEIEGAVCTLQAAAARMHAGKPELPAHG